MDNKRKSLLEISKKLILDGIIYSLSDVVGEGGSSIVYRGYHNGKPVIIKELYPKALNNKSVNYYYHREPDGKITINSNLSESDRKKGEECFYFYMARAVRENNIIDKLQVCGDGKSNDPRFFESKLFSKANNTFYTVLGTHGGDILSDLLHRRDKGNSVDLSTFAEICECILRILEALKPVHDKGYLHLDVAPDNIHILAEEFAIGDGKRQVKLIDFNSAFNPDKDNINDFIFSKKEGYSAYELENKSGKLTPATDLYSVAAVFFFMLIKRAPDVAIDLSMPSLWHLSKKSDYCEELSSVTIEKCNSILLKGIGIDSSTRYQSIKEFTDDMNKLINSIKERPLKKNENISKNDYFVGRDKELKEIDEKLRLNNFVFLEGMGGIGKTELAKKYTYDERYKLKYENIQLLHFTDNLKTTIATQLEFENFDYGYFENAFETKDRESHIYEEKINLLKKYDERTLIIIDNFNVADNELYEKYGNSLPNSEELKCKFIFTTRYMYGDLYGAEHVIKVKRIDNAEDLNDLFYRHSEKLKNDWDETTKQTIKDIIEYVDGHTMTIELISKTFENGIISLQTMYEKLREGCNINFETAVRFKKDGGFQGTAEMYIHILSVFNISENLQEPIKNKIMMNMSLVPSGTGIDKGIFIKWLELENNNDINELIRYGWIRENKAAETIALHPIISDIVANELKPDSVKCVHIINAVIKYIETQKNKTYIENNELINTVQSVCNRIADETELTSDLYFSCATIYGLLEQYSLTLEYHKKALYMRIKVLGINHKKIAASYDGLGSIYYILSKYAEASEYFTKSFDIRMLFFGKERELEIINSYNNYGLLFRVLGEYDKALGYFGKVLDISIKNWGEEHEHVATAYSNISLVYRRLGEYREALKYCKKSLDIRLRLFGKNHKNIATAYNNIASISESLNKHEMALKYFTKALNISITVSGEISNSTATIYSNIGSVFHSIDNYDMALKYHKKALDIRIKLFDENEDIAKSYKNIGSVYHSLGKYDEALKYYEKALDIRIKLFDENDINDTTLYSQIGDIYYIKKNYSEALEIYLMAISNPNNANEDIYKRLSILYKLLGDSKKSKEYKRKAKELEISVKSQSCDKNGIAFSHIFN